MSTKSNAHDANDNQQPHKSFRTKQSACQSLKARPAGSAPPRPLPPWYVYRLATRSGTSLSISNTLALFCISPTNLPHEPKSLPKRKSKSLPKPKSESLPKPKSKTVPLPLRLASSQSELVYEPATRSRTSLEPQISYIYRLKCSWV